VAHAAYMGLDLIRVTRPLQARFHVVGPTPDGYIEPRNAARIRFYSGGLDRSGRWCGVVPLSAPVSASGDKETIPYRLGRTPGTVRGGSLVNANVPLDFGGRPFVDVPLVGARGVKLEDKRVVALQVGQLSVKRC
jgi:hypothetical protein